MAFELSSPFLEYDPEEEERKRTAALAALAAQAMPEQQAFSPGELDTTSTLTAPTHQVELPQVDIVATPEGAPQSSPFSPYEEPAHVPLATAALAAAGVPQKRNLADPANAAWLAEETAKFNRNEGGRANPVPPAAAPPAVPPPPVEQDPLEALMRRGEEQRMKQLEAYERQGSPGPNGWAILADVVFNKGKSIPGILQQSDADKRAYEAGRQKLLTGGHSDPVNQMIAMGNLQARQATGSRLAGKDAVAAEQEEGARKAFMSAYGKYMTPDEQEQFANAPAATFRTMSGQFRDRMKNDPDFQKEHARGVGLDTEARTHTANVTNANDAELLEEASHARGTGNYRAQTEQAPNKPLTPNEQLTQDRLARIESGNEEQRKLDNERRGREETEKREGKDRDWQTTFANRNKIPLQMAKELESIETMIEANDRDKKPTPGIDRSVGGGIANEVAGSPLTPNFVRGLVGDYGPDDAKVTAGQADRVTNLLLGFESDVIKNQSGAAYTVNEEQRNKIRVGASPSASGSQKREALRVMHEIIETNIGTQASANPEIAARALMGGGITPERYGAARWRAANGGTSAPAIDPELGQGQSLTTNDEGDEVVEGAYADPRDGSPPPNLGAAKVPKVQKGSRRTYTVKLPSGKTKKGVPLSDQEVEMYRLKGIQVE